MVAACCSKGVNSSQVPLWESGTAAGWLPSQLASFQPKVRRWHARAISITIFRCPLISDVSNIVIGGRGCIGAFGIAALRIGNTNPGHGRQNRQEQESCRSL